MGNLKTLHLSSGLEENGFLPPREFTSKDLLVSGLFQVDHKIGSGSFGKIHLCTRVSNGEIYAVKFETESEEGQLNYEYKLYQIFKGHPGFPKVHHFGIYNYQHFMIMDYLGPNLETLFNYCQRKFSLKTILMIIDQLICRIEQVHSKSFIYRDIKPENFVIGRKNQKNQIFMIDFGLAKLYRGFWTHKQNKFKNNCDLVGTVRYSSINTHMGIEQSRRDDLESIGYMIIYFLKGRLPWQGFKVINNKERHKLVGDKKIDTSLKVLCEGLPEEFVFYLDYCKDLTFSEEPNYSLLRSKFRNLFLRKGYVYDYQFDWEIKYQKEMEKQRIILNGSLQKKQNKTGTPKQIDFKETMRNLSNKSKNNLQSKEGSEKKIIQFLNGLNLSSQNDDQQIKKETDKKSKGISRNEKENQSEDIKKKKQKNKKKKNKKSKNKNKKKKKKKVKSRGNSLVKIEELININNINSNQRGKNIPDLNIIEKLEEYEERKKFYNNKENPKLKIKVEKFLLQQQQLIELTEKQKKSMSEYFLRTDEIYLRKYKEMCNSYRVIEEKIRKGKIVTDETINQLMLTFKMDLNTKITINSLIFLEIDHIHLLYLIDMKKSLLQLGIGLDFGNLKIKKIKKSNQIDKKLWIQKNMIEKKKLINQKFTILQNVFHLKEVKLDEKIQKLIIKIQFLLNKNMKNKKLDRLNENLDNLIDMVKKLVLK
ncbi:casein kinase 1-like protein [Anaeramoeba flamelloides]|uniref:non-specific serine/threonine protein kinase n=1 Tax=Anaeramoeba flamelloides TaxID=1746091 RepID=A0AAV8A0J4_9EUKA|nr:casein kinase 1-like protein [Anaeramoeba flamelloides]